jgi:hypothetical protein
MINKKIGFTSNFFYTYFYDYLIASNATFVAFSNVSNDISNCFFSDGLNGTSIISTIPSLPIIQGVPQ